MSTSSPFMGSFLTTMNNKSKNSGPARKGGGRPVVQRPPTPPEPPLSQWSTSGVRDSTWCSMDFKLGAGMIIIQQNTHKIVVVHETKEEYWFFPRGRKDVGESIEQTALREAYEESGYRAEFLPLYNPTRQPPPPDDPDAHLKLNTEPITLTLTAWRPRRNLADNGGEYLTTWFVGRIPEDAVKETGTGMADEQNFESHLLTIDEAMERLWDGEQKILQYVWAVYVQTWNLLAQQNKQVVQAAQDTADHDISKDVLDLSLNSQF